MEGWSREGGGWKEYEGRRIEGWREKYRGYYTKIRKRRQTHMQIILEHNSIK